MADEPLPQPSITVDEKAAEDAGATTATPAVRGTQSPRLSPQLTPPSPEARKSGTVNDYYASRPRFDKLGNPIPDRRRPSAMSSVYSAQKVRLPGDLGASDPRRPSSPASSNMPGDLGPNDPRRPRSAANSPAPSARDRGDSDPPEPEEGERIQKDPPPLADSSSESGQEQGEGANENDGEADSSRGRIRKRPEPGRTTSGKAVNLRSDSEDSVREGQMVDYDSYFPGGVKPDPTKGESALLFKATKGKTVPKKRVHPYTAFDAPPKSGISTPVTSDDEHHAELKAAQKLSLTMSQIHSTPSAHRVIRQIIRGDYAHFQQEAEEGRKRQRMYLVATDLSDEAEYALEWTIGTVLRDGDTLFAVYAVDLETAGSEGGVEIGAGADSVRDTAAIVRTLTTEPSRTPLQSPLARSAASNDAMTTGTAGRSRSRGVFTAAETERRKAIESITERCVRLLRKTRLQVRVVVEVFHCKSPRHTITEVIDYLSPTLVIIGSRGQSAVKGVLLGSFSNYLVTKSSVPVMVARKKLRKHGKGERKINRDGTNVPYSGSGRKAIGRLSNVISAPRKASIKVDWDKVGID